MSTPLIVNVCETVKGGVATYLNVLTTSAASFEYVTILPADQLDQVNDRALLYPYGRKGRRIFNVIKVFFATLKFLKKGSPVIFLHSSFALPLALLIRLVGGKNTVLYCSHGWGSLKYEAQPVKKRFFLFFEKIFSFFCDININISSYDFEYAESNGIGKKNVLIENAVIDSDICIYHALKAVDRNEDIELLFVGRFDRQKGVDILLESYRIASEKRKDLKLTMIGESVLGDDETLNSGLRDGNVSFPGWVDASKIARYFASADLVVVPSRWEGFGLVVAEAYRSGTPVLVSDKGALPSLVKQGKTGFVFELKVEALVDFLLSLKKNDLLPMRANCRRIYEDRFCSVRFGKEITDLINGLKS